MIMIEQPEVQKKIKRMAQKLSFGSNYLEDDLAQIMFLEFNKIQDSRPNQPLEFYLMRAKDKAKSLCRKGKSIDSYKRRGFKEIGEVELQRNYRLTCNPWPEFEINDFHSILLKSLPNDIQNVAALNWEGYTVNEISSITSRAKSRILSDFDVIRGKANTLENKPWKPINKDNDLKNLYLTKLEEGFTQDTSLKFLGRNQMCIKRWAANDVNFSVRLKKINEKELERENDKKNQLLNGLREGLSIEKVSKKISISSTIYKYWAKRDLSFKKELKDLIEKNKRLECRKPPICKSLRPVNQLDETGNIIKTWENPSQAAKGLGFSPSMIYNVLNRTLVKNRAKNGDIKTFIRTSAGGFRWEYVNNAKF